MVLLSFLQSHPSYACEEDKKLPLWEKKRAKRLILIIELYHHIGPKFF